jgi:isochorismate pyruvate lyase
MDIRRAFTGTEWEGKVGYCRALRIDRLIWVTGTVAVGEDGKPYAPGDGYAQARRCFAIIEKALGELDAGLHHVVRTRMFVTDISRWKDYGRAHGEVFAKHPPTTSMIEIKGLIAPEYLIEVEADAYVP